MSKFSCIAVACCFSLLSSFNAGIAQTGGQPTIVKSAESQEPRRSAVVKEDGSFESVFPTLKVVLDKSRGNKINQLALRETELISLNTRCDPSKPITFSMHRLVFFGIDKPVKDYFDFVATLPKGNNFANPDRKKREAVMISEIQSILSKSVFLRKAECDAVPMMLSIGNYESLVLETDDAQSPLIGTKINDGMLHAALIDRDPFVEAFARQANTSNFVQKYGYNRFTKLQDAVDAARLSGTGNKVVVVDGTKMMVYRLGDFKIDYSKSGAAFDSQFDVFKTAKIRKGWTILAVVIGRDKAVRINIPSGANTK